MLMSIQPPAVLLAALHAGPVGNRLRAFLHGRNEQGQSLVEFALCLPVLMLIVTGLLAFGLTINNYMLLTEATNVAARQLAINSGQTTDPCSIVSTAVYAAAPILKKASLTFTLVLNGVTYNNMTTCSSTSTTTGAAANLVQNTTATVKVTYPCSLALTSINAAPNCLLTAQTAELVQ